MPGFDRVRWGWREVHGPCFRARMAEDQPPHAAGSDLRGEPLRITNPLPSRLCAWLRGCPLLRCHGSLPKRAVRGVGPLPPLL